MIKMIKALLMRKHIVFQDKTFKIQTKIHQKIKILFLKINNFCLVLNRKYKIFKIKVLIIIKEMN